MKNIFYLFLILVFLFSSIAFSQESNYQKGIKFYNQRNFKSAISYFKKAIKNNENIEESYFFLGLSYINLKKYREAYHLSSKTIELYKKKINENPNDINAYYRLGYVYELMSFVPGKNYFKKAISYFEKAQNLNPKDVGLVENIAFCYISMKDYKKAIEFLENANKLFPNNLWIEYYLGVSYFSIKDYEHAKSYFSEVLDKSNGNEIFLKDLRKKMGKIK